MSIRTLTVPAPSGETALERRQAVREDRLARLERMIEARAVETSIRELHEAGRAWGTTHTAEGQEAVAVGIAAALRPTDLVCFPHRIHTLALAFGVTPEAILGECLGKATGVVGGLGGSVHVTDTSVGILHTFTILGAQVPVAAGVGLALQVQGSDGVAVSIFGDGSANMGAFHEGLNLAAVWQLPVVFICENNHYSEYTRYDKITAGADIAGRGAAYAIPSRVADGQDVDVVVGAVGEAAERARAGGGPSLVELQTYRWYGHSRSDAAAYRDEGEADPWIARDPIAIYAARLREEGLLTDETEVALRAEVQRRVDAATEFALAAPEPEVAAMFRHVLAGQG